MIEATGDMWSMQANAVCVTTNGSINRFGHAVMGRGVALQASRRFPGLARELGRRIGLGGNHVYYFETLRPGLFSFPVKHAWHERADIGLICKSAMALEAWVTVLRFNKVLLPRPGCGNGGLDWKDVRPAIEWLPDSIVVVTL